MKRLLSCLGCMLLISAAMVAQDLRLDKLSDCDTLAHVQNMLQGSVSSSCRMPRDQAERQLMSRLRLTPRLNACLLSSPPTSRLAGFICVDIDIQGSRELACYHVIDARSLKEYQRNDNPTEGYRYKQAAARCPSTNRDVSDAANSLFPQILSVIGKPELGFIVGIGNEREPHTRAYHGFGDVDPDLRLSGAALEVFDMVKVDANVASRTSDDSTDAGQWKFEVIDMPRESQRDFARPLERASGERIGVRLRLVIINSARSSKSSFADREANLESWQQSIADYLDGEGFRSLTRAELSKTPFNNTDQMRDFIANHMPFGNREFAQRTLGPHLVVRLDDDDDDCTKVAEAFVAEPEQDVRNDFGGFGLIVFTIGRCRDLGGSDEVLDPIIQKETEIIESEVKRP